MGRLPAPRMPRELGGRAFGDDPAAYDGARPEYPPRIWQLLESRCGLGPGCRTLEIGPGTGLATRRLIEGGARPLVAVEPDERLAAFLLEDLRARGLADAVSLHRARWEEVDLSPASFDLAVCATAFHWVEPHQGLARVARVLRPGGWWAMWWTVFGDPDRPDPLHDATAALLAGLARSPSAGVSWRAPFSLDEGARRDELEATGAFEDVAFERIATTLTLSSDEARGLYATFSSLKLLPPDERERLLDSVARVVAEELGGRVERPLVTAIYTARRAEE